VISAIASLAHSPNGRLFLSFFASSFTISGAVEVCSCMKRSVATMWYWLTCLLLLCGASSCSTVAQWRHTNTFAQIDRIFSDCAAKRGSDGTMSWTETVQCGNDGVQSLIEQSGSPYVGLIAAALQSRLALAQQIDAGVISVEDGQARLAALDTQILTLPGSVLELLSMTAAVNPR
jgi:hypothetical protein